jgi:hypothetical protein
MVYKIDKDEFLQINKINLHESIKILKQDIIEMEDLVISYEKKIEKVDTENEYLRERLKSLVGDEETKSE